MNIPFEISQTRQLTWANLDAPGLNEALALENRPQILAAMMAGYKDATQAFIEKRASRFEGR